MRQHADWPATEQAKTITDYIGLNEFEDCMAASMQSQLPSFLYFSTEFYSTLLYCS